MTVKLGVPLYIGPNRRSVSRYARPTKIAPKGRWQTVRPRGFRRTTIGVTLNELLAMDERAQGTSLERMVDGAARALGIQFTGFQVTIPLTFAGRFTRPDRMLDNLCIYIDGPQHFLRPEQIQIDTIQTTELQSMGYEVVHLQYNDLIFDPIGTVRRMLLLRSFYA